MSITKPSSTPIYLDYAATTPVDEAVAKVMAECLTIEGNFANPASRAHLLGWRAEEAVEHARRQVAKLINADAREIVWTSGATESDNLAIKGVVEYYAGQQKRHIITSMIEHKAVLDTCRYLETKGYSVTYLQPSEKGLIEVAAVRDAIREDTLLVSLMHVNNEIGTVTNIAAIGELLRERGVLFHVDAAQSIGKLLFDVRKVSVDLVSISSHKLYGPKGIGVLYVRRSSDVHLTAQIHGGGHERGMRSGTLPTHQIVGMGQACEIAGARMADDMARLAALKNRFWEGLERLQHVRVNGCLQSSTPSILNVAFEFVEGEALLMALSDLAISTGSACNSASVEPSFVLQALGVERKLALGSLRFSFGRHTTEQCIDYALSEIGNAVQRLRAQSPEWKERHIL